MGKSLMWKKVAGPLIQLPYLVSLPGKWWSRASALLANVSMYLFVASAVATALTALVLNADYMPFAVAAVSSLAGLVLFASVKAIGEHQFSASVKSVLNEKASSLVSDGHVSAVNVQEMLQKDYKASWLVSEVSMSNLLSDSEDGSSQGSFDVDSLNQSQINWLAKMWKSSLTKTVWKQKVTVESIQASMRHITDSGFSQSAARHVNGLKAFNNSSPGYLYR